MSRLICLSLGLVALVPLSPLGCPPTEVPQDLLPLDRGTLPITADAQPATANFSETVTLHAAATSANGALHYSWLQIAGTGASIDAADQDTATFQAPSVQTDQTLTFMATAHDDAGAVGRATVSVTVAADPDFGQHGASTGHPRADAGADQIVAQRSTVTLDGSNSVGVGLTYSWRQLSGVGVSLTPPDAAVTHFTAPTYNVRANVMLFELSVKDASGNTYTDRTQVTVKDPNATDPQVTITTTLGVFVVELNQEKAPKTVQNFLQYVDDKFYDGTIFHRVIKDFVIQGGGYTADLTLKPTRPAIPSEANNGLHNVRGSIAMARTSDPNSATSQWYVNLKNNIQGGDGTTNLDPNGVDATGYTVFGTVISGMDVVDRIGAAQTHSVSGFSDVPMATITINSARRVAPPSGGGGTPTGGTDASGSNPSNTIGGTKTGG